MRFNTLITFVLLLLVSCGKQHAVLKQANASSKAGDFNEAATLFYNVLLKDKNNADAKQGLIVNGQQVIADKFAKFSKQVIENKIEDALKTYRFAKQYAANAASVGVVLNWPTEYNEVYEDIKQEYIINKHTQAINLMQQRQFESAEKIFEQMALIDSSYAEVSVLRPATVVEPLYKTAQALFKQQKYKEAYQLFSKIAAIDDGYKDVLELKNKSLQMATSLVGVLPVANDTKRIAATMPDKIADLLIKQQSSYFKLANVQLLHNDMQSRGFSKYTTENDAIEIGTNLNLGYTVLLLLDTFIYSKTEPVTIQKIAYEAVTENILNPYTKTYQSISKFKQIYYTDNTQSQQLQLKFSYTLVSTQTKKVLVSNSFYVNKTDEWHAATYQGNKANIYPSLPESNYMPQVSQEWRNMFNNPKKSLKPFNLLLNESFDEVAYKIAVEINQHFK